MKVLVTGSTGFLGAAICRALVARGDEVRVFHRPTSTLRLIEDLPVEHALGDLTQPETLPPAMQGVEAVFHTAALLGGGQHAGRMYTITVEGTRAVVQAALEAGVRRVVHTSSVAALGVPEESAPGEGRLPLLNENHTWNYRPDYWPYGYAKYLAELEVQRAVAEGLDAVIVNPAVVLGAGDIYRKTSSVIVQVAQRKLTVSVDGGLNVVHLDDVVAGHLAALEYGKTGQRYILGGENMTLQQFQTQISAIAGVPAPSMTLPAALVRGLAKPATLLRTFLSLPLDPEQLHQAGCYFYYDIRKAQVELRLEPPKPAESAIREAYDWFVEMGAIQKKEQKSTP